MNIYEQFGRLTEQYQAECANHIRTVGVLRALKQGKTTLDQLTVNDDNSWIFDPSAPGIPVTVSVVNPPDDDAAVS